MREPQFDESLLMPSHWTYDTVSATSNLAQGDIIEPTAELQAVLKEVHPHFLDPKYVSFLILSQSCDLVRRPGYRGQPINLCIVRELNSIAGRLLELFCGSGIAGVFREEGRQDGRRFLERVINQNEQAVGLFYLHPDADAGVTTPSVAMLRIAIALRADHYDKLVNARRGRVKPEFQAKLGWLIGNLYSRVGTEDWSDPEPRKSEQEAIIKRTLDSLVGIEWGSQLALRKARDAKFTAEGKSGSEIRDALKAFEPPTLDALILAEISRIVASEDLGIDPATQKKLMKRLPNDRILADLLKRIRKR